jgi:hypothetical protein
MNATRNTENDMNTPRTPRAARLVKNASSSLRGEHYSDARNSLLAASLDADATDQDLRNALWLASTWFFVETFTPWTTASLGAMKIERVRSELAAALAVVTPTQADVDAAEAANRAKFDRYFGY